MNHLRSLSGLFCACALVIGPCGCDAGPKRYGVSGEVRYKGKPLDHGGIIFLPESPTAGADSGGDNIKKSNCQMLWTVAASGGFGLLHPIDKPDPGDDLRQQR